MKIICTKANLLKGVNIVSKAVPSRTTMAILECILIKATDGIITLTSNDMEFGIETIIDGEIIESGTVAVEAKLFSDFVRKAQDSDIIIEIEDNTKTTLTCEKTQVKAMSKNGNEFSYLPQVNKENHISISQFTLKEVIRQTIFSIGTNENNKLSTGELFEVEGNILKVVALDGHRIAYRQITLKDNYEHKKIIVPGKTLIEISKILNLDLESDVKIYFTENHVLFEFDNTTVVSRLIEGEFFNVKQLMSNDYSTKVIINKRQFLNSIDRATILTKEGDKKPLIINMNDISMELKLYSDAGKISDEMEIKKEGKDLKIGFNPKFLIDALKVIEEEEVTLYFENPKAPCFIKDFEGNYNYLILPVNFVEPNID